MDTPNKGGLAFPGGQLPMDAIVLNQMMPVMRELYTNTIREQRAHKDTLTLLQAIVRGEIDAKSVTVTDDGWQVAPDRPRAAATFEVDGPVSGGLANPDIPPLEMLAGNVKEKE